MKNQSWWFLTMVHDSSWRHIASCLMRSTGNDGQQEGIAAATKVNILMLYPAAHLVMVAMVTILGSGSRMIDQEHSVTKGAGGEVGCEPTWLFDVLPLFSIPLLIHPRVGPPIYQGFTPPWPSGAFMCWASGIVSRNNLPGTTNGCNESQTVWCIFKVSQILQPSPSTCCWWVWLDTIPLPWLMHSFDHHSKDRKKMPAFVVTLLRTTCLFGGYLAMICLDLRRHLIADIPTPTMTQSLDIC